MASLSMPMSSAATSTTSNTTATATPISNINQPSISSSSSSSSSTPTVKPCCVCKEEKAVRDECMLFSSAADPQSDCASTIDKYKSCMAGFGFKLP